MTAPRPTLIDVTAPAAAAAVVLVLHGGREASLEPVGPLQLAALRMVPIGRRIARAGHGSIAVARLRYAIRGWNGDLQSPVADAQWALDQLSARYPGRPIGLVGHSMGGRTALRVGGHPGVRSVVGLAAWLPRDEPISQLDGRRVLLIHGDRDRTTSPNGSAAVSARLRAAGIASSFVEIVGERHGMLRQPKLWHDLTAGFLLSTLLPEGAESGLALAPNHLRQVIRGDARITI
jgi:predicted esterase